MNATFNRHSITAFIAGSVLVGYAIVFLVGGIGPYLA